MRAGYHSGNVLQCPVPVKLTAMYQQFLSHDKSDLPGLHNCVVGVALFLRYGVPSVTFFEIYKL